MRVRLTSRALLAGLFVIVAGCVPGDRDPTPGEPSATSSPAVAAGTPSVEPTPSPAADAAVGGYLALGDSLAVGVGATQPDRRGYVPRLGRALGVEFIENLAVSGETSQSLLDDGQLHAAVEIIRSAEPGEVEFVTLDIGGNDLLRLLRTQPCAGAPNSVACRRAVAFTLADFERNYRAALAALREALDAAAPSARLAVMTYFNPFDGTDAVYEAGGRLALLGADLALDCDAANESSPNRGMNDVIACVGMEFAAVIADVQPRFAGLGLKLTHIGSRDIHANDRGYRVIAEVFVAAIDGEDQ